MDDTKTTILVDGKHSTTHIVLYIYKMYKKWWPFMNAHLRHKKNCSRYDNLDRNGKVSHRTLLCESSGKIDSGWPKTVLARGCNGSHCSRLPPWPICFFRFRGHCPNARVAPTTLPYNTRVLSTFITFCQPALFYSPRLLPTPRATLLKWRLQRRRRRCRVVGLPYTRSCTYG